MVTARNILFLKIISTESFDPSCSGDMQYLWDVMYNMEWPYETFLRFRKDVEDLKAFGLPVNLRLPARCDRTNIEEVWSHWLNHSHNPTVEQLQIVANER